MRETLLPPHLDSGVPFLFVKVFLQDSTAAFILKKAYIQQQTLRAIYKVCSAVLPNNTYIGENKKQMPIKVKNYFFS